MRNDRLLAPLCALLLAACGNQDGNAVNGAGTAPPAGGGGGAVQTGSLTGLYERGEGERRNQLCMVERERGGTAFGLVVWGSGNTNCSGWGRATREGDRLRLAMEGDETCVIDARIEGGRVALPTDLPQGCGYYCGPSARMAGTAFDKVGGTLADALRAHDLVGDPLCGS